MIDVLALNGARELLTKMTPTERGLFLLFGYASNQVNVLWKLVSVATDETPENPIEQRVSGAQTQIERLLIGVLFEAWRLVHGRLLERIPVMFVNKRSQRGSENSCILRD